MPESRPKNTIVRSTNKSPLAKQAHQPALVAGLAGKFKVAIERTRSAEPTKAARTKLLFGLIVEFLDPVIATIIGDVETGPITLSHHEHEISDLQAIEIRQELLEEIISHTKAEAKCRAFLKRFQGKQLAILAVPCRLPNEELPFAILAIAANESQSRIIREALEFMESLAELVFDISQSPHRTPTASGDDMDRLIKASSHNSDVSLAFQIVNAIATKFHCEQVAVGLVMRNGIHLTAISGTSTIKRNSPGTILLEQAMEECSDQTATVAFPRLKFQDNSAACGIHQALSKASGQAAVCSIPVTSGNKCVAIVTLRRAAGDTFSEEELKRLQERLAPCGPAFQILMQASRSLKEHAKDAMLKHGQLLVSNNAKLALLCLTAALLAWLIFGKTIYKPNCSAELAAAQPLHIASPLDGVISKVHVRSGDFVHSGTPLIDFDTSSVQLEKKVLQADIGEATVDLKIALSQSDPKSAALQQAKIDSILAKLDSVEARLEQADVQAPADGRVVRCDLSSKIGQEFKFGMPLMELSLGDAWKIQIQVPDTIAPYVASGQQGYFAPFGRPGESYRFTITSVNGTADVKNGKNVFVADAILDIPETNQVDWMKVGMSGVAKISTESRPVYWVYFHDALDWLHKAIWY